MDGKTDYYKAQLKDGLLYQDFIYEVLHKHGIATVAYSSKIFQFHVGENKARMEIKFDKELKNTGNLWIETAEKSRPTNPSYVESGICRNSVEYIIGDFDVVYRIATNMLRALRERYNEIENRMKTSRGFLLPAAMAEKVAIQVLRPNMSNEMAALIRADLLEDARAKEEMARLISAMKVDPNQMQLFGK